MHLSSPSTKIAIPLIFVFALVACNRSPAGYVAKGNKYFAEGKYDDAALEYRNALKKDPKYAEAYYRTALIALRQNNYEVAYDLLKHTVELNPRYRVAIVQEGDLAWLIYRAQQQPSPRLYNDLSRLSNQLLTAHPKDFDGLRFKAYVAIADKRVDDALTLLQKAASIHPFNTEVALPMAQLRIQKGDLGEGEKLLRDLIAHNPSYGSAYRDLYALYMREHRVSDAETILRSWADKNPNSALPLIELAQHYANEQNSSAMKAVLEQLHEKRASMNGARMALGDFYALHHSPDEALRAYQEAIRENPANQTAYRKKMVTLLAAIGKRDEAEENVDEILKANPKDTDARRVKAGFEISSQKAAKVTDAVNIYKELSNQRPSDADLRFFYGRALLAGGDVRAARNELLSALRGNPAAIAPRIALAQLDVNQGQYAEALQLTSAVLDQNPTNETGRLVQAMAEMGIGERQSALTDVDQVLRQHPKSEDAELELALFEIVDKHYAAAEKIFGKYYQAGQTDQRPLEGLIRCDLAQGEFEKALDTLNKELQKSPKSNSLRLMLASVAIRGGKFDIAESEYKALAADNPASSGIQLQWADLLHSKGDHEGAIEHYQKAKDLDPHNPAAASLLGREFEAAGRQTDAIAAYRDALKADPNYVFGLNNLAFLLAQRGQNLDEALQMALNAQHQFRDNLMIADTLGWVYLKKGLTGSALQVFLNNVKKDPNNPAYRYHLAEALFASGDKVKAKQELQKALQSGPSSADEPNIRRLLAKIG